MCVCVCVCVSWEIPGEKHSGKNNKYINKAFSKNGNCGVKLGTVRSNGSTNTICNC